MGGHVKLTELNPKMCLLTESEFADLVSGSLPPSAELPTAAQPQLSPRISSAVGAGSAKHRERSRDNTSADRITIETVNKSKFVIEIKQSS